MTIHMIYMTVNAGLDQDQGITGNVLCPEIEAEIETGICVETIHVIEAEIATEAEIKGGRHLQLETR